MNSYIFSRILINFNVNHTVDTEEEAEIEPTADKPDMGEMRSKPQFEVDIVRGTTTLSFTCSFLQGTPQEGEYSKFFLFDNFTQQNYITKFSFYILDDVFGIDEMTIYQGEWNEKIYAVAGDVLDGVSIFMINIIKNYFLHIFFFVFLQYLYDLLMNLMEEKGISNEFVEKMSDLATAYEHSSYIGLLESLSKFTTGK